MKYLELKELIKDKNIRSIKEWKKWVLDNRKLYPGIPIKPDTSYKNEFEGYIIFLNSKRVKRSKYWSYKRCVEHLKSFNFTLDQFRGYIKCNKHIPIPTRPDRVFKEFVTFIDFLSNDNISVLYNTYYTYTECVLFLKEHKLGTVKEFRLKRKQNKWKHIPSNPEKYYREFKSYDLFLSNTSVSNKKRVYLEYNKAKKYLSNKNLNSLFEYKKYITDNNICFLPKSPLTFYKSDFLSAHDFLSNSNLCSVTKNKQYNIDVVRKFISDNNLQSYCEYLIILKRDNSLLLPTKPYISLKNRGYNSIEDLFGRNIKQSSGELMIEKYLKDKSVSYIKQHKFNECKFKRKLPFDFYLPEHNMCIEFDGEQHFKPVAYFGGIDGFNKVKTNDAIKDKYCKDNDIRILRIPFSAINNIDTILKNKLKI